MLNICLKTGVFILHKEGEAMRFGDYLSKEQKQQLNKMASKHKPRKAKVQSKPKHKKQEDISFSELERMMGKYRDTYTRRNGAVMRK
jgi:hypothetical protein